MEHWNGTLAMLILSLVSFTSFGQEAAAINKNEYLRMDSVQASYEREQAQSQRTEDIEKITALEKERSETKSTANEAQRVEEEANDAARQSKSAMKSEKKAQKARKHADRQAQKAKQAREKSNLN